MEFTIKQKKYNLLSWLSLIICQIPILIYYLCYIKAIRPYFNFINKWYFLLNLFLLIIGWSCSITLLYSHDRLRYNKDQSFQGSIASFWITFAILIFVSYFLFVSTVFYMGIYFLVFIIFSSLFFIFTSFVTGKYLVFKK